MFCVRLVVGWLWVGCGLVAGWLRVGCVMVCVVGVCWCVLVSGAGVCVCLSDCVCVFFWREGQEFWCCPFLRSLCSAFRSLSECSCVCVLSVSHHRGVLGFVWQRRSRCHQTQQPEVSTTDVVPCDCVLLRGACVANEATISGESVPQMKDAVPSEARALDLENDRCHCLFSGSRIVRALGVMGALPLLEHLVHLNRFVLLELTISFALTLTQLFSRLYLPW